MEVPANKPENKRGNGRLLRSTQGREKENKKTDGAFEVRKKIFLVTR